jgi:hypothetical protein
MMTMTIGKAVVQATMFIIGTLAMAVVCVYFAAEAAFKRARSVIINWEPFIKRGEWIPVKKASGLLMKRRNHNGYEFREPTPEEIRE